MYDKGIVVDIGGNTAPLQKALKEVNSKSKDLQNELKQVKKLLKLDPTNVELVAQKQKLLSDAVENTTTKLNALKQAEGQVQALFEKGKISETQYRIMQRDIIATQQSLKNLNSELNENEKQVISLNDKMRNLSNSYKDGVSSVDQISGALNKTGNALTSGVTSQIIEIGTASAKAAIDFETAFAGVEKTVDATDVELVQLEQGIRDMAKEIPASTVAIAGISEAAGQLGIKTENILDFTRVMLDLGESTNLSSEKAAIALAKFANVTQMSQKDFDKLGSVIVDLGNNMDITEADIVAMATRLSEAGSQVGMSEFDIMALSAALSSVGIESEAGGSAFSKLMLDMQMATQQGEKAVVDFAGIANMSAKEFITLFKTDATSAVEAFIDGLSHIKNSAQVLDDMKLSETSVRNALLGAAEASDVFKEAIKIGSNAWNENTALANEASKRYETTESKLNILKNTITDTAIELGENFLPTIQNVANDIGEFANKFGELDKATQESIIKFALLAAGAGPILKVAGSLTSIIGGLSGALSSVGGVTGILTGAIGALTGPLGIAAVAIGTLAGVTYGFVKSQEEQREALINSKDSLNEVSEAYDNVSEKTNNINDLASQWDSLNAIINDSKTSSEDLAIAKQKIAEVETQLIENSEGIINRYDIENGKIAEKIELLKEQSEYELEFAKINMQQEVNNTDINKLQEENKLLEDKRNILQQQAIDQQDAYAKLKVLESEWASLESQPQTDETIKKMNEIYAEAEKISTSVKVYISDIMLASDEANLRANETQEALANVTDEYNNSSESIQAYYDTALRVIELNLGGEYEVQASTVGIMKNALDELNFSGVISNETFDLLKNILPELTQNESDSATNANYLKTNIEQLQTKVMTATTEIINLNREVAGLPDEKKIDVRVAVLGADSLKDLMNTIGVYQEKLNDGGLTMRESRAYVDALDELERRQKPKVTMESKISNEPAKKTYITQPKAIKEEKAKTDNSAEKVAREAEKKRKEELKAWEDYWKDREEQSKDWISTEKFYNRLSETEEVEAYQRLITYMKEGLAQIDSLEIATNDEKLKLKKDFSKKIESYEKQQYTTSKNIAEEELKNQEEIRSKELENIEEQITNQEQLINKLQLYVDKRKQLESNMTADIEAINQKYWLNEKERLEEAENTYEQYTDKIKDTDKKMYEVKKNLIIKTANEMKTSQLECVDSEISALEKAYKKQSDILKKSKSEKIDAINAQSKIALSALDAEQKHQESNYNSQIKMIEETGEKRIEALQSQIDAINKSATSEDRNYDLNELQALYDAYKNSSTAEGQAKAEELRRQIRDINNSEKVENLNSEISKVQKDIEAEKRNFETQYEQQTSAYEAQKQQLQAHYDNLLASTEEHYSDLEEQAEINYNNEKNSLEAKKYIIDKTNKEILENVDKFAIENMALYGKNQADILALLNSKSGSYYSTAQSLGKAFYDGLQIEMEKVNDYMRNLSIPNLSLGGISPSANGSNGFSKSSINNYNLSVNDYGSKNFNDKIDIDSYNKELGNTILNKTKFGFGW